MDIETIIVGELKTNCYLIIKDNKCLIIDPGDEFNKIKEVIDNLHLTPLCVLITHYHFDHIGCLDKILEEYKINKYDYSDYVNDNEIKTIDNFKFKMIYTPGHKSDLITYFFEQEKIMFVGDFIFKNNIGRWDLDTGNKKSMLESINKIKQYSKDIKIYPGHGVSTTLIDEFNDNPYF